MQEPPAVGHAEVPELGLAEAAALELVADALVVLALPVEDAAPLDVEAPPEEEDLPLCR